MLLRDRKAIVAALLGVAGYAVGLLVMADLTLMEHHPAVASFAPLVQAGGWLDWMLRFTTGVLLWRLAVRAACTTRVHGWREGMRSVPRVVVSNTVNAVAAWRATRRYIALRSGREALTWDKTAHRYPAYEGRPPRLPRATRRGHDRLGDRPPARRAARHGGGYRVGGGRRRTGCRRGGRSSSCRRRAARSGLAIPHPAPSYWRAPAPTAASKWAAGAGGCDGCWRSPARRYPGGGRLFSRGSAAHPRRQSRPRDPRCTARCGLRSPPAFPSTRPPAHGQPRRREWLRPRHDRLRGPRRRQPPARRHALRRCARRRPEGRERRCVAALAAAADPPLDQRRLRHHARRRPGGPRYDPGARRRPGRAEFCLYRDTARHAAAVRRHPHHRRRTRGLHVDGESDSEQAAFGVRWQVVRGATVSVERLFAVTDGGRTAWTMRVAGGRTRKVGALVADAYAEAGIVGLQRADLVAGVQARLFKPDAVEGLRFESGVGLWSGIQHTGEVVGRLDVGPTLSIVADTWHVRASVDYRFRVAGNAAPGSGPALTVSRSF